MATLLEGGVIIDGVGSPPTPGSVLIEGDRISAVGALGEKELPADLDRVDASGHTIMPGLIDAHCHISFDDTNSNDEMFFHRREGLAAIVAARNVQKLTRAGVTGFLDADSIYEIGIDLRDALEAGIVEGPRMVTGGNALVTSVGGTAGRLFPDRGRIGYAVIVRSRDEIIAEVRRQIKHGVDWIKVHVTGLIPRQPTAGEVQAFSFDELRTICDTAHELGIRVVGHCRSAKSIRESALAGFDMILHATNMDEAALEAIVEASVMVVPTLTFQANLADYGEKIGASPEVRAIFRREIEDSVEMLTRAYRAGVPLLCGSESGFSLTPYGEWHHREMEVYVNEFGLTPLEAIRCATSEGARALGLYGETGEIAAGRLADVIVVDGDPSKDVAVLGDKRRIRHVFAGGRSLSTAPLPALDRDPPGWRVTHYGDRVLRWADVNTEHD